jgi:hypothetical protein
LKLNISFDERLVQLAKYKRKNGHCKVPKTFTGYNNLGMWVNNQRRRYRKYKEKKPKPITVEQIRALKKLNFKWRLLKKYK